MSVVVRNVSDFNYPLYFFIYSDGKEYLKNTLTSKYQSHGVFSVFVFPQIPSADY